MTAYGKSEVPVARSMHHIQSMLYDHDCESTRFTDTPEGFTIEFLRPVKRPDGVKKMVVSLPVRYDYAGCTTTLQKEQRKRTMWRSSFHYLKAMFDSIEKNIIPFEEAFLANFVVELPDGTKGRVKNLVLPKALAEKQAVLSLGD